MGSTSEFIDYNEFLGVNLDALRDVISERIRAMYETWLSVLA